MDFRDHLRALWALRVPLVLVALLVAGGVVGYQSTRGSTFTSTVALDVVTPEGSDEAGSATTSSERLATMATGRAVLADAAARAQVSVQEAEDGLTASAPDAGTVELVAQAGTAAAAPALALAGAQALVAAVEQQERDRRDQDVAGLQSRLSAVAQQLAAVPAGTDPEGLRTALTVQVTTLATAIGDRQAEIAQRLSPAGEPSKATASGGLLRLGVLTFLLALLLVGEAAVAVLRLSGRLLPGSWPEQVQRLTGSPLLAVVAVDGGAQPEPSGGLRVQLALRRVTGPEGLTLLPLSDGAAPRRLARDIARSATVQGRPGLVVDASRWPRGRTDAPFALPEGPPADGAREVVLHGDRARLDAVAREEEYVVLYGPPATDLEAVVALALIGSAPVLVLDARQARTGVVREWATVLREAGCAPVGAVLLHRRRSTALARRVTQAAAERPSLAPATVP